jgi:hypothetical protein
MVFEGKEWCVVSTDQPEGDTPRTRICPVGGAFMSTTGNKVWNVSEEEGLSDGLGPERTLQTLPANPGHLKNYQEDSLGWETKNVFMSLSQLQGGDVEMIVKDLDIMMMQCYDKVLGMISGKFDIGGEKVHEMSLFQGIRKDGVVVAKIVSFLWGQKGTTFILGVVNQNEMDSQLAGVIFKNTKSVMRFKVYAKSSDIGLGKCSDRCTRCNEKLNRDNRCMGCKHSGDYLTAIGFCLDCHREYESYDKSCKDVIGDIIFTEAPRR